MTMPRAWGPRSRAARNQVSGSTAMTSCEFSPPNHSSGDPSIENGEGRWVRPLMTIFESDSAVPWNAAGVASGDWEAGRVYLRLEVEESTGLPASAGREASGASQGRGSGAECTVAWLGMPQPGPVTNAKSAVRGAHSTQREFTLFDCDRV